MGDSLVVWRVWRLWGRSYKAIIAPASLWAATLCKSAPPFWTTSDLYLHTHQGIGIVSIWLTSIPLDSAGAVHTCWSFMVTWAALMLATNVWTVGMISSVYW